MKSALPVLAVLVLAMGAQGAVTIDLSNVEDAGNAADVVSGVGAVAYDYAVGTYQVTNAQYAEMLNAVAASDTNELYNASMGSEVYGGIARSGSDGSYTYATRTNMADKPVNYVTACDAMRFVNWLANGQPTGAQAAGTTEGGVYTMTGISSYANPASPRNNSDSYFLPTEDEWVKAGHYDPRTGAEGGPAGDINYWQRPIMADTAVAATADATGVCDNPGPDVINTGSANWNGTTTGNLVTVGSCEAVSYYGQFDMAGNVYEFTETESDAGSVWLRGGGCTDSAYWDTSTLNLPGAHTSYPISADEFVIGFRVAHAWISPTPGDTDGDGDVDLDDFNVLKGNFESGPGRTWAEGDFTGDGEVKLDDFVLLKNNFTGGAAVPEPATLSLLAIATCLPLRRRRR